MLELQLWQLVLQQVISFKMENKKLSRIYYSPKGFWKGLPAVKKLSQEAGPSFDVELPNAVHQADLLFLPHDKLPRD